MNSNEIFQQGVNNLNSGNFSEARKFFKKILRQKVDANALSLLAICDLQENNLHDGVTGLEKALKIDPNNEIARANIIPAKTNYGINLVKGHNNVEAKKVFKSLIDSNQAIPEVFYNLGNILMEELNYDDALACFNKCIALNDNFPLAYNQKGLIYKNMNHLEEAEDSFLNTIKLNPNNDSAYHNLGNIYFRLKKFDKSKFFYEKAISLNPKKDFILCNIVETDALMLNLNDYKTNREKILNKIDLNESSFDPFFLLTLTDDLEKIRKNNKKFVEQNIKKITFKNKYNPTNNNNNNNKIRVGYISSDFRIHAVGRLVQDIFQYHNTERFEIFGYSLFSKVDDEIYKTIKKQFKNFRSFDIEKLNTNAIIQAIQQDSLDVLIDLNGHTQGAKTEIFNVKLAKYSINYLGYLATMGMNDSYDFILADHYVINDSEERYYDEDVLRMDKLFLPVNIQDSAEVPVTRNEFNLPEDVFIYCSFNNPKKLNPEIIDLWMKILSETENTVLFIYLQEKQARENMLGIAIDYKINSKRIIFADFLTDSKQYLRRYRACDLFLDSYPFSAGTTATDCISTRTPILTLEGRSYVSRMSSSILNSLNQRHLITKTKEEYIKKAIAASKNKKVVDYVDIPNPTWIDSKSFVSNLEKLISELD